jgi:Tol biopolymer transport system component
MISSSICIIDFSPSKKSKLGFKLGATRVVTNGGFDYWPDWSPDAKKIVFVRCLGPNSKSQSSIYLIDVDGKNLEKLRI